MEKKRKDQDIKKTEIKKEDILEIEHQTLHPGNDEITLKNVDYAPGENNYLSNAKQDNLNE
ncbi:hypothetical protein QGM71_06335 [Virgibacillus sp. C22-A2]|uniref:DUF4025 domain-containing protein n=1 Tax=Virgibacillus tibetensis TaxID=3042313 RepID=A0ABU6KCR0_9BACI|nr:hypothetical protein [Virgibacillus sp. C22-A2]